MSPTLLPLATSHNASARTSQNVLSNFGKEKEMGKLQTILIHVHISMQVKMDYDNDKYIHAPTYTYNEVM
jgi:hypothetical protein